VAEPPVTFAGLLRKLRTEAGLTQEELAAAARVSSRSISDLERGINQTARKDTARLLAKALNLTGTAKVQFEAVAQGRTPAGEYAPVGAVAGLGAGIAAATRTLPRDIASFTGREPELRELVDAVAGTQGSGGVVSIHAIGGMAGIGKTAFAVHAAHQLASRFPEGQIFLPLHGHTPGQRPVHPADALAILLMTAGVPAQQIPPDLEARMALWRDRLAGRQLLLVLDDAADSEQVRPLLPGTGQNLVLVTSRRHLSALEDAQAISLDTLPPGTAAGLLVRLAARPGLSPGDAAVAEITRLCGYLPLAVGMLARQLHHHPAWTPADLAADLAAARDRLELMQAENLSVAAAFNLSYEDLTEAQKRLFRRLGLHLGTDIDAYAAAALDGTDLGIIRRNLDALYNQYLLTEPARGRYRLHDLIREHARALASRDDPESDRDQAIGRLFDYYQHSAETANRHLTSFTRTRPATGALAIPTAVIPDLTDSARALSWAQTERANLLACLDRATRTGQHGRVVALTAATAALLQRDGPWTEAITCHITAAQAARHLGDQPGEASALHDLGVVRYLADDYAGAAEALQEALSIYRDIGDPLGQANALRNLGSVRWLTDDYAGAAEALQEALSIYRDIGDRLGQANALNHLGEVRRLTDDPLQAAGALQEALAIYRDIGDRPGQANALNFLGGVWHQVGDYQDAVKALQEALGISRDIGHRLGQANVLDNLGVVLQQTGDYPGAAKALEEALAISRHIGDRMGLGYALTHLGVIRRLTGDYPSAAELLNEALGICRDIGDRGGEAQALNEVGALHQIRGEFVQANACHRQALEVAQQIASSLDEAHALAGLGRCALAAGRTVEAERDLRQAQEIFQRIGAADTSGVSAALDALHAAAQAERAEP